MSFSVAGVLDALRALPRRGGGRAIMFLSAQQGDDAVEAARAVAEAAGPGSVYAIDLDVRRNALARRFSEGSALGPRISGALNGHSLFGVSDARCATLAAQYYFHRVGRSRVYVGALDGKKLPRGAVVSISSAPTYWNAARAGGATVVVHAPALERSRVALRAVSHMDGVVLVVGDGPGAAPTALAAKTALQRSGANLIGLVYAGATAPMLTIERLLRQAG